MAALFSHACIFMFALVIALAVSPNVVAQNGSYEAIYAFGDSLTDTGNLLRQSPIGALLPISRLPYGMSMGGPTGRCSDGLLMVDFIATHFGLPYINPYLNQGASFANGVNFAVAGATALASFSTTNTLGVEQNWFNTFLGSICPSDAACKERMGKSLLLLGEIGGNDYNYGFMEGRSMADMTSSIPSVVGAIQAAGRSLIQAGFKHVVVPGDFPIGCFPIYLTSFQTSDPTAYDQKGCLKSFNQFSENHNSQLQAAIQGLREEFPAVDIRYADLYNAVLQRLTTVSARIGSQQALSACCGVGGRYNFSRGMMCGTGQSTVCRNPSEYLHWDGIHLTQESYKEIVNKLIADGVF